MILQRAGAAFAHAAAMGALIVVPALALAPPTLWRLDVTQLLPVAAFALAYLIAALLLAFGRERPPRLAQVLLVGAALFGSCTIALVLWADISRPALEVSLVVGMLLLLLNSAARPGPVVAAALSVVVLLCGVAGQMAYRNGWLPRVRAPQKSVAETQINSSLYGLQLTIYRDWVPRSRRFGGGLAALGNDYLLATGDGELYVFNEAAPSRTLQIARLPRHVPLNTAEFIAGATAIYSNAASAWFEDDRFRVGGLLVQELDGKLRVFASHHYWHADRQCFVMRVSMLEASSREQLADPQADLPWRTLYETTPCLKLNTTYPSGPRFEGLENGGRLVLLDPAGLLFSVGDHAFDGVTRPEAPLSQDPNASYGKIVRIDIDTGKAQIFSSGLRNPQGLRIDAGGTIWETEHGPQGGDEINIIREGRNYGWPLTTFGTDYARRTWPLNPNTGRHEGFEPPVHAFLPSLGLSNLVFGAGAAFPLWHDDLLVGSLAGQRLLRVRVTDGRAMFVEPIALPMRVRDILLGHDGRIVMWGDGTEIAFLQPTESRLGDALVTQCASCHGFNLWDHSTPSGPSLYQLFGRRVASRGDFEYSPALRDFGGRWSAARLDSFLANPQAAVPGTAMRFPGIADPVDRQRVVHYLQELGAMQK
jgi:aldose sugar dehydrogenase